MSCTNCGDVVIYNAKRKLCRKCYSKFYNSYRKGDQRTHILEIEKTVLHERELDFINSYFKHTNWVYSPASYHLPLGNYSPDFYDGETNTFIEVVGSRQAYHANKEMYVQFREKFPEIRFEIRKVGGDVVDENDRMDWVHGMSVSPTVEEVKKNIQLRFNMK